MRKWTIFLSIAVAIALVSLGLQHFLPPSEVIEIQARVLPLGEHQCCVTDLDGDGNDEIIAETVSEGWFAKHRKKVIAVTMRKGKFVTFPVPIAYDVRTAEPKGRWLVGRTDSGDIAVVEMLPNGEWRSQILLPRKTFEGNPPYPMFSGLNYVLGDLDRDGLGDDVIVQLGSKGERILWFGQDQDGQWRKRSEIILPTVGVDSYFLGGFYMNGVTLMVNTITYAYDHSFRIFFWDGQLRIGRMDEWVYIFEGDWMKDGQMDELLVRFLKGGEKVHWQLKTERKHHQYAKGEWLFKGWQIMNARATNKLGDGKWHLVLAMAKPTPLTVRVVDCHFEPQKGWRIVELFKQRVKAHKMPNHIFLHIGDTDGDGQNEIEVAFDQRILNCLLYRIGNRWEAKSLNITKGQTSVTFFPLLHSTDKMWFERVVVERTSKSLTASLYLFAELGTFDAQKKWKPMVTYSGAFVPKLHDLNNDNSPELITFEGLIGLHPVLCYRSRKGEWRKAELMGGSVGRLLNAFLHGSAGVAIENAEPYLVRWEGKEWFVVVWTDGIVQAVTLSQSKRR